MNPYSTLLLGMAMSTDAFAISLGKGAGMHKPQLRDALRIGALFGVIEGLTAVVGWLLGSVASRFLAQWSDWIAFALLLALGAHMIWNSLHQEHEETAAGASNGKSGIVTLLLASVATSIDSLAIGIGLAFMHADIALTALVIGACVFASVSAGILAGRKLGEVFGKRAELIGGIVLIAVGAVILFEHYH